MAVFDIALYRCKLSFDWMKRVDERVRASNLQPIYSRLMHVSAYILS